MKLNQMFSKNEVRDIVISVLAITIIFSYPNFSMFPTYLAVVVIAFLFHELGHRTIARRFGAVAFYKMWVEGLILGLALMFMKPYGFIPFVAPGAVVIYPFRFARWGYRKVNLTQIEMGIISFVGPAINLVFAFVFRLIPGNIFFLISSVNAWLAMFNLLPIPPLDGSKILRWKTSLWLVMFFFAVLFVLSSLGII
jgi:Zn-dependent protease